jgi:hypothetical protein
MRKISCFIVVCLVSCLGFSQTKSEVKKMAFATNVIDSTMGLLVFRKVIMTELPDSIVYKRAAHWYKTFNKSMRLVSEECVQSKKLVGKAEVDLLGLKEGGRQPKAGRLKFTVVSSIDNSRVTVEVTRFNIQNTKYSPVEPWLSLQVDDPQYKYYFIFIEEYCNGLLDNYNELVNVKLMK